MSSVPYLSLILPAYNEVRSIGRTLAAVREYLDRQRFSYEVLVCADGDDGTRELVQGLAEADPRLSVLGSPQRSGKGHGIRAGVAQARGQIIGFMDADNKTPIEELAKVLPWLERGYDLVIGSRALDESRIEVAQPLHRRLGSKGFALCMRLLTGMWSIGDTQCGFKFFRAAVARDLFGRQRIDGYMFDVEILYLARRSGYRLKEVGIRWRDDGDSRLRLVAGNWQNLIDLFRIRFGRLLGRGRDNQGQPDAPGGLNHHFSFPERGIMKTVEQAPSAIASNSEWFDDNHSYMTLQGKLEHYRYIQKMVEREVRGEGDVLDVGNGGFFNYDTSLAGQVTAVDLFLEDRPGPTPNSTFRKGSFLDLPFADASFDCVLQQNVLHHVTGKSVAQNKANLGRCMAEMYRCLRPGGKAVVIESTVGPLFYAFEVLAYRPAMFLKRGGHPVTFQFTARQLLRGAEGCGFQVEEFAYVPRGWFLLQFGYRWPCLLTPARPVKLVLRRPPQARLLATRVSCDVLRGPREGLPPAGRLSETVRGEGHEHL